MATTDDVTDGVQNLIDGMGDQSKAAVEAARKFVDSVTEAIPDGPGSDLRDKVIQSAFAMTHQVVDASHRLATGLVDSTGKTIGKVTRRDGSSAS